jgi:uncharacterized protein (TIGR02145 family)
MNLRKLLLLSYILILSLDQKIFSQFNPQCENLKNKGNYEFNIKNNPKKAIKYYSKAYKIDTTYYPALYNRAWTYSALKEFDKAIVDLNKVIKLMDNNDKKVAQAYVNRGNAYRKLKEFDRALADYNKSIEIDATVPQSYYNRALIYQINNQADLTCIDFYKSIQLGMKDELNLEAWCSENFYKRAVIGNQIWMSENYDISQFQNGEVFPQVKSASEWIEALENKKPVWCYYNFDSIESIRYGKIYNWYAVNDTRGLAPKGWRIPSSDDVQKLEDKMNTLPDDGTFLGRLNSLGFNAEMFGNISYTGESMNLTQFVAWWTSDQNQQNSWSKFGFGWYGGEDTPSEIGKKYGFYIRCIKN